ncbi:hypothetical protein ACFQ60_01965 [Streptomyces zhihengii]
MADGELVVDARSFTADVTYQAPAQDRVLLATVHRGTMIDTTGGHHDVHEPGDTFLLARPRPRDRTSTQRPLHHHPVRCLPAHRSNSPQPVLRPRAHPLHRPATPRRRQLGAWAPPSRSCATTSSPTPRPPTARSAKPPPATSPPSPSPPSPTPPGTPPPQRPSTPLRPPRPCAAP